MFPLPYMTNFHFISLSCLSLQGARGLDGEPGPQGIPGAAVSSFPFIRPNDRFLKSNDK